MFDETDSDMLNKWSARTLLFLCLMLIAEAVFAQPQKERELQYGNQVYTEAVQLPSDSAGAGRIDVFLRITYDYLIFSKSSSLHPDSLFAAGLEASVHVRRDGVTIQSKNLFSRAFAGNYEATSLRDRYLLMRHTFYLPPGSYDVLITISDKGSSRSRSTTHNLKIVDLAPGGTNIGYPVSLAAHEDRASQGYAIYGYGAILPFAENALLGVPVPTGTDGKWTARLTPLDEDGDVDGDTVFEETIQPAAVVANMYPAENAGVVSSFDLVVGVPSEGSLALLALPIAHLDVGRYRLSLKRVTEQFADSISIDTRIYWRSMPYSLRDIDFAINAMRYILTKEEFDIMRRGDNREMTARFRRYWKEQDPTPETEYNERLVEYFLRVDKTIDKFQTLYERNGAMTDRGKVYILFGPPEDTHRVLNSDEPAEETWYYPTLNKTFRFIDRNRNGDLKLYEE
jgi:GWxTD domain-containing protein